MISLRLTVICALLAGFVHGAADACQICIPYPKKSLVDMLLESDAVVLAREDPDRPFSYAAVEVLKGMRVDDPIDVFVNSTMRRRLASYPEDAVVLVNLSGNGKSQWKQAGLADSDIGPIARDILRKSVRWAKNPEDRFRYFVPLLGHANSDVRAMAHLEVARAPYRLLRTLRNPIPRKELRAFLDNFRYAEWHPLYILLLANDAPEEDRTRIRKAMRFGAQFRSTRNIAAWATALIEIDGVEADEFLRTHYLGNPSRKTEEIAEVAKALSVHGANGDDEMRDRVVKMYGSMLRSHPAQVAMVVDDLNRWNRDDLAADVGQIAARRPPGLDLKTLLKIRAYARRGEAGREGREGKVGGG